MSGSGNGKPKGPDDVGTVPAGTRPRPESRPVAEPGPPGQRSSRTDPPARDLDQLLSTMIVLNKRMASMEARQEETNLQLHQRLADLRHVVAEQGKGLEDVLEWLKYIADRVDGKDAATLTVVEGEKE